MPAYQDFSLCRYEDGVLTIGLAPPVPIGGMSVQLTVAKRFGSTSGLIVKSMASGYYGVSGLDVTNSGQGTFRATINGRDTSGLPFGNYAFQAECKQSGQDTVYLQGFFTVNPTVG